MNIDAPHIDHIPALRSLWRDAFGDSEEFLDAFYANAFHPTRCRCATIDGKIVAALYWFDCLYMGRPLAYLYAVATAKSHRGQGICHKLMERTHLHLAMLGYAGTILVPGSRELFRLYETMGYHICSHIREFCCTGSSTDLPLTPIDKTTYASLRRQFLPRGGVIQEDANLDFLQTQARFYNGPGFLLAAHGETDTLYGVELLGDTTVASGIVHSLGYTNGVFRTPGDDMPFAMYHALGTRNLLSPTYFGLAFDSYSDNSTDMIY